MKSVREDIEDKVWKFGRAEIFAQVDKIAAAQLRSWVTLQTEDAVEEEVWVRVYSELYAEVYERRV